MARIRTMPKAVQEMREADPNTVVTYNRLRRWVKEGKIRSFNSGRCPLVDLDEIERLVSNAGC